MRSRRFIVCALVLLAALCVGWFLIAVGDICPTASPRSIESLFAPCAAKIAPE
jgi:hypothetical protein